MLMIRYLDKKTAHLAAVTDEGKIFPLAQPDFMTLIHEAADLKLSPLKLVEQLIAQSGPLSADLADLHLLTPIEAPEIWAAGVTYERSRDARNYEVSKATPKMISKDTRDPSTFYDLVYDAVRPELFLKSNPLRTVGPNEELCLRSDSVWQIPEPELALVLDRKGKILGYTVGNDMSSRDIEGQNPLYLPQAKIWRRSCAIGPGIKLVEAVADPYQLQITMKIYRDGQEVVAGTVSTGQLKRKLAELVSFLIRDNDIYDGTVLLTGTGIVPPNEFSLVSGDRVEIHISEIGTLSNTIR